MIFGCATTCVVLYIDVRATRVQRNTQERCGSWAALYGINITTQWQSDTNKETSGFLVTATKCRASIKTDCRMCVLSQTAHQCALLYDAFLALCYTRLTGMFGLVSCRVLSFAVLDDVVI